MVDFFKNVPALSSMSTASLMRLDHLVKLKTFDVGGKYVFKEG